MFHNLYFACAAIGGCILVLQTLLTLLGGGHGGDVHDVHGFDHAHGGGDHDSDHGDAFVKFFTFKTIVAFITFFGLAGLACEWSEMPSAKSFTIALGAGAAALFAVGWLMQVLARLHSAGNLELEGAVGCAAQVYLRIPARGAGAGKVTVTMQGRTVELAAVTTGPEIATGSAVKIVALREGDTLEVLPLAQTVG
jgi:hypothetical protein